MRFPVLVALILLLSSSGPGPTGVSSQLEDDEEDYSPVPTDQATVDPCKEKPCINGICLRGARNGDPSGYHCYCEDGYTGIHCETDWDECWSSPCLNGAQCIDQVADFNCTCASGFRGKFCEVNIDECRSDPCQNNGTCVDAIAGYFCECPVGFAGINCEIDVSVCNTTSEDEKKCHNGGRCIDGFGATFTCECTNGWTGSTCDDNVDECLSSPCENGGMCMDTPGSYICSCPFGYAGLRCQTQLEKCDSNPCQNEALCFIVQDSYECYCVPDYHGPRCQFKYDDCAIPPLPKCFNGGRCIDGVDGYNCSCPPGFEGEHCECPLDDPSECINVNESVSWTIEPVTTTSVFNRISTTLPTTTTDAGDMSVTITSVDDLTTTTLTVTTEEVSTEVTTTAGGGDDVDRLDPFVTVPTIENATELEAEPEATTEKDPRKLEINPTRVVPAPEVTSKSPVTSLFIYELTSSDLTTRSFTADTGLFQPKSSTGLEPSMTPVAPPPDGGGYVTIPVTIVSQSTLDVLSTKVTPSTEGPPEAKTEDLNAIVTTPLDDALVVTEAGEGTALHTPEAPDQGEPFTPTTESATTEAGDTVVDHSEAATTDSSLFLTSEPSRLDTPETNIGHETILPTELPSVPPDMHIEFEEDSCAENICSNGGSCFSTITGPRCHCPLQFRGALCEEEIDVSVPGFVGHSLLVHKLAQEGTLDQGDGFQMMLSFRTSNERGILFYSEGSPNHVMISSFIESGILKFKVNCGVQNILFSDPRHKVSTGYQQTIELLMKIEVEQGVKQCVTVIHLNETHTMRGTQEIEEVPTKPSSFYFGQMPRDTQIANEIEIIGGFQGCMKYLQINNQDLHLYADASSGRDIVECNSAACATKPCQNGAVCAQHGESGLWQCNCPPGFAGRFCERAVCATNPCRHGGTCLGSKTGPGFLCLCPLGREGVLCEDEQPISQPGFTTSVGGYSSFMAYKLDATRVAHHFQGQFHFSTEHMDQIALLFFLGQEGLHEFGSDYVAVSYVKGHVLLTWDLGSGPRRIFTKTPIDPNYIVHTVRFGRTGRSGWLQVDRLRNITGRAPGLRRNLNVTSQLVYLGGHENHNFSLLPHDLPLHRGFDGCLFDFSLFGAAGQMREAARKSPAAIVPLQAANSAAVRGRNVGQCYRDVCAGNPCYNGGTCLGYGASFICACPDGWFGIRCQEESSACTIGKHKCAPGAECAVHQNGTTYCMCPFGMTGEFCDQPVRISDPKFLGSHSYMKVRLDSGLRFSSHFGLELKPSSSSAAGTLLFLGQSQQGNGHDDFLVLTLENNTLFYTVSLGGNALRRTGKGTNDALFKQYKLCCANTDEWNQVEFGREGRKGYLTLNGETVEGEFPMSLTTLDVEPTLFLGSLDDDLHDRHTFATSASSRSNSYEGCIRNLHVNSRWLPLAPERGWTGYNVADCDGTQCGGELCQNDGHCLLDGKKPNGFKCECPPNYTGRHCDVHVLCEDSDGCQNGAICEVQEQETSRVQCHCKMGFAGAQCEKALKIREPKFRGDGFMRWELPRHHRSFRDNTELSFEMKTVSGAGLVLWIGDASSEDYLGLGIRRGMLHLVWNLGWLSRSELSVAKPKISDGRWHSVRVERTKQSLILYVDGVVFGSQVSGSYSELNVGPSVFIGGSGLNGSLPTLDLSRGHFESSLRGCVRKLLIQGTPIVTSESEFTSASQADGGSSSSSSSSQEGPRTAAEPNAAAAASAAIGQDNLATGFNVFQC